MFFFLKEAFFYLLGKCFQTRTFVLRKYRLKYCNGNVASSFLIRRWQLFFQNYELVIDCSVFNTGNTMF